MPPDKLTGKAVAGFSLALIGSIIALFGSFLTWNRPLDSETGIFDNNIIVIVSGGGNYFYLFFVPILAALALGLTVICASSRTRGQGFGIAVISLILFCIVLFYHIQYSISNYKPQEATPYETFITYLKSTIGILVSMLGSFLAIIGGVLSAWGLKPVKEGKMIIYQPVPVISKPMKPPTPVKMQPLPYTLTSAGSISSRKFEKVKEIEVGEISEEISEEEFPPPPSEEEEEEDKEAEEEREEKEEEEIPPPPEEEEEF